MKPRDPVQAGAKYLSATIEINGILCGCSNKMANYCNFLTVTQLQSFLKERGVIVASLRKAELHDLCEAAIEIGIQFDPDGLNEDRDCVLNEKLLLKDKGFMTNPALLEGDNDLSILPPVNIVDIYSYLSHFSHFTHA